MTYAIIKTGGKQYKVSVGDKLKIEKLTHLDDNQNVIFNDVLMLSQDDNLMIGNPMLAGATVTASVISQGKYKKVRIFKLRRRKHYQRHQGHRQNYTEIQINAINVN